MNIIRKKLADLQRPEHNVRIHNAKQLHEFRRSLEMFGQIRPLVVDENGIILAGNGLYEAMWGLNYIEADCYVVNDLTEAQKKKLMLADNRIYDLGLDDIDTLDAFIKELGNDFDIPGFDAELLQAMAMEAEAASVALCEYGLVDEDKTAEIVSTGERYAQEQAAEKPALNQQSPPAPNYHVEASETAPQSEPAAENTARPYAICPKCGEQIWL